MRARAPTTELPTEWAGANGVACPEPAKGGIGAARSAVRETLLSTIFGEIMCVSMCCSNSPPMDTHPRTPHGSAGNRLFLIEHSSTLNNRFSSFSAIGTMVLYPFANHGCPFHFCYVLCLRRCVYVWASFLFRPSSPSGSELHALMTPLSRSSAFCLFFAS